MSKARENFYKKMEMEGRIGKHSIRNTGFAYGSILSFFIANLSFQKTKTPLPAFE